jgi:aminoglycoside phosphotransferase (APT) family kinase protein
MMDYEIARRLQTYYEGILPIKDGAKVRDLVSINPGWESELYAFTLEVGPPSDRVCEELVLRLYPGDDAQDKAANEFRSMRRLYQVGYPVPQVRRLERIESPFGKPFIIMDRIRGEMMWTMLSNAAEEKQLELTSLFCKLFVRLHALDWRLFVDEKERVQFEDPYVFVDRWLSIARGSLEHFAWPGFLPIVEWLQDRRETLICRRPSPIHNDFHPSNILLQMDGSPVVIDWTGFRISDSRFDLAWTLVLTDAYLGPTWRNHLLREYEHLAGDEVEALDCFEVIACARRLFDLAVSVRMGAEKMGMRSDTVTAMREDRLSYENVYVRLVERTGIGIKEVEDLISSLG